MGGDLRKAYRSVPFFCGRMDALSGSAPGSAAVAWGIGFFAVMEMLSQKRFFHQVEKRIQKICIFIHKLVYSYVCFNKQNAH